MKPVILEQLGQAGQTTEDKGRDLLRSAGHIWSILDDLHPDDMPDREVIACEEARFRFAALEALLCAVLARAAGAEGPLFDALTHALGMVRGMASAIPLTGDMPSEVFNFECFALRTLLGKALGVWLHLASAQPTLAVEQ
jgi:hypothetical protein